MRQLTAKQKKLLAKILDSDKNSDIRGVDDLPTAVWDELERINDTEILWQEANRFIYDYNLNKIYG